MARFERAAREPDELTARLGALYETLSAEADEAGTFARRVAVDPATLDGIADRIGHLGDELDAMLAKIDGRLGAIEGWAQVALPAITAQGAQIDAVHREAKALRRKVNDLGARLDRFDREPLDETPGGDERHR
jgi:hypothetical protein